MPRNQRTRKNLQNANGETSTLPPTLKYPTPSAKTREVVWPLWLSCVSGAGEFSMFCAGFVPAAFFTACVMYRHCFPFCRHITEAICIKVGHSFQNLWPSQELFTRDLLSKQPRKFRARAIEIPNLRVACSFPVPLLPRNITSLLLLFFIHPVTCWK